MPESSVSRAELEASSWPFRAHFLKSALVPEDEDLLANTLLSAYSVGMVELHCLPPEMATRVPEHPRTAPLAALQLHEGHKLICNLMHLPVNIENDFVAQFLKLCDGTRTQEDLVRDCQPFAGTSEVPMRDRVSHALKQAIQLALFVR